MNLLRRNYIKITRCSQRLSSTDSFFGEQSRFPDQSLKLSKIDDRKLDVTRLQEIQVKADAARTKKKFKVSIFGAGDKGLIFAQNILSQGYASNIVIIDDVSARLKNIEPKLRDVVTYKNCDLNITSVTSRSNDSDFCILAHDDSLQRLTQYDRYKHHIESAGKHIEAIGKYSSNAVVLETSQPSNACTYAVCKIGKLSPRQVFGLGTALYSIEFRKIISKRLKVPEDVVEGWIIGGLGNSKVPVWSSVKINGKSLFEDNCFYLIQLSKVSGTKSFETIMEMVERASSITPRKKQYQLALKGKYIADMGQSIFKQESSVHCFSTLIQGKYGINRPVMLSLPLFVTAYGSGPFSKLELAAREKIMLRKSASISEILQDSIALPK